MDVALGLLGGHHRRGHHGLDEARVELARAARHLEALDVPGLRMGAGIGLHPGLGGVHRLARLGQLVDHLHAQRLGRPPALALQHVHEGPLDADEARQALRAAAAGEQADEDLGQPDRHARIAAEHAMMAGERQLQPAAHAGALDCRRDGLAARLQPAEQIVEHEHLAEQRAEPGAARIGLPQHRVQIFKVHARHEPARLARCDDGALDRLFRGKPRDGGLQIRDELGRDDVHRLAGHVDGEEGDAVRVDVEGERRRHGRPNS